MDDVERARFIERWVKRLTDDVCYTAPEQLTWKLSVRLGDLLDEWEEEKLEEREVAEASA